MHGWKSSSPGKLLGAAARIPQWVLIDAGCTHRCTRKLPSLQNDANAPWEDFLQHAVTLAMLFSVSTAFEMQRNVIVLLVRLRILYLSLNQNSKAIVNASTMFTHYIWVWICKQWCYGEGTVSTRDRSWVSVSESRLPKLYVKCMFPWSLMLRYNRYCWMHLFSENRLYLMLFKG